ncbi:hypothetical protein N7471_010667 [Penicillium samsonianum]|uniref:uncharacterized protein n=1 Tax=Penicillium samsonianum TaxID=1882272 RepID=UPI00254687D5|nr:uncharacterized protein N7471_010667 [Penicillium samsonianum]KAJ6126174.1 hypothetical protein N7471_010667 [Penicillium samsonianum]
MPQALLPSSAAAFAPRTPPSVVLDAKVPQWLTATLKRVSPARRRLNNPKQQTNCLLQILSPQSATWALCSMMLDGLFGMIHIEAYVVYVDMVSQNEVAFKLTKETISILEGFHEEFLVNSADHYSGKQAHANELQEDFVKAVNKFIYRTNAEALEGLQENGSGELLCGNSADVKAAISRLFVPIVPSPPIPYPYHPLPGRTMLWTPESVYVSGAVDAWNTQSTIPLTSITNQYNPTLESTLDVSYARSFSIDFVSTKASQYICRLHPSDSFDNPMEPPEPAALLW